MTDLEICKRVAQIEGVYDGLLGKQASYNSRIVHVQEKATIQRWFNPLKDRGLCFELIVRHEIDIIQCNSKVNARIYSDPEDEPLSNVTDKSPQRAICLAIIEANK